MFFLLGGRPANQTHAYEAVASISLIYKLYKWKNITINAAKDQWMAPFCELYFSQSTLDGVASTPTSANPQTLVREPSYIFS